MSVLAVKCLRNPLGGEVTYDAVIPIGQWCATALCLKRAGLRSMSAPFDWVGFHEPLSRYVDIIESDFDSYMLKKNLRLIRENTTEGSVTYKDLATGLNSVHDFRLGIPFDEMYQRFRQLLNRRKDRLLELFHGGGKILLVHHRGEGHYSADEILNAVGRLRRKFPETILDLLVLESYGVARTLSIDVIGTGIVRVTGDFYDKARYNEVLGNEALCLNVLKMIRLKGRWRNLMHVWMESVGRRLFRRNRRCA